MANRKRSVLVEDYKEQLKELGNRIKYARQARGMTQGEVADVIGVSSKTISAIEVARVEASISQIQAIAAALNEPIGYFTAENTSTVVSKLAHVAEEFEKIQDLMEIMNAQDETKK